MIDTIIFDVGRVLVNWDYESYLKRFAFGPEKTKAITAATFESPYWRQFDRGILTPEEIVKGFCSLTPDRCVFLDDTRANVEAAEQAGIHGIHFTGYEDGVSQLKKLGVL